ncbi:MAG: FmdE family protein [Anaerolineae bacterium]
MPTLTDLLTVTAREHQHLCPRQVLGVRMGIMAAALLNLELPQRDREKRLLTFVETDGCFADGVVAATGCTVGHRTLRVVDYGKVAATFVDTKTGEAVRIAPHPDARQAASRWVKDAKSRWHAQLEAYQIMPDAMLLTARPVTLTHSLSDLLSRPGMRVTCASCGEEIINEREVVQNGLMLCLACAGPAYYAPAISLPAAAQPVGSVELSHR